MPSPAAVHARAYRNLLLDTGFHDFLDLAQAPAPLPDGGGHLVRFLADQQGCLYWYLHVTEDGADHAPTPDVGARYIELYRRRAN
ncbi:hypothetical protein [Micromonospora sp. CPCC 206061]|uniref:hypothetical protein n=1 Tax=Micromonospora sp. CPCC 206061 TaxID=3122410 RepID=UPI002FF06022